VKITGYKGYKLFFVEFTHLLNIPTSAHYWYYYFASRFSGWKPDLRTGWRKTSIL